MNALSAGWWTAGLYQYNDPDGVPLIGRGDQAALTLGENRARLTNAAITGMVLLADNLSKSNVSGQGNPTVSRKRAEHLFSNTESNALLGTGRTFKPIYGYKEYGGKADGAENFAMLRTGDTLYVAIINYDSSSSLTGRLPLSLLGINGNDCLSIRELWQGEDIGTPLLQDGEALLPYDVPARDARIYCITLKDTSLGQQLKTKGKQEGIQSISHVSVFSPAGIPLDDISPEGLRLVKVLFADGTFTTLKYAGK